MKTLKFIKDYQLLQGLLFTLLLSQLLLGARIQQGQGEDIYNLVGSQLVFFALLLVNWIVNQYFIRNKIASIHGFHAVLSLVSSIILSISFYYISPFEDYAVLPLRELPLHIALIRLTVRGLLVFTVIYPIQYYLFQDKKNQIDRLFIERQKQEALNLRIAFLGQQLDPHFLFNSLSVLRAGTDDPWVKSYVN